jgi:hypothetical protein
MNDKYYLQIDVKFQNKHLSYGSCSITISKIPQFVVD